MEKNDEKKAWIFLFLILAPIIISISIKSWALREYSENFCLESLLVYRFFDLFVNSTGGLFYAGGLILYGYVYFKLEERIKYIKLFRISLAIGIFILYVFVANLLQDEIYTIDGEKINRYEAVVQIGKDCISKETVTIVPEEFSIDTLDVRYSGPRVSSITVERWYINLDDKHITPIASSIVDEILILEEVIKETEFTVYKNSKVVSKVDGVELKNFMDSIKREEERYEIHMHENGHIDITQVVFLKRSGNLDGNCQVCFEKEGQILAGFSVESVKAGTRGVENIPDGTYRLYITWGGSKVISNVIEFTKNGDKYEIMDEEVNR